MTNNLASITASSTGTSGKGVPWSANFWTSAIPELASNMNFFKVHPGDLKKQFQDLPIPGYPLVWSPALGNVSSGYNQIIIANAGAGPGFPHELAPYQDTSSFAACAKRYTDGGYLPLNDLSGLAENVAPNNPTNALFRHAAFVGNANIQRDAIIPQGMLQTDFSDDFRPDILFENLTSRATSVRFLDGSTQTGSAVGLTIPAGWTLAGVADLSRNSHADYVLFNPTTRQTEVRYAVRGARRAERRGGGTDAPRG